MYHALALLTPASDLTLSSVTAKVKAKFPKIQVQPAADRIDLAEGDWDYHMVWQSGAQVLQESEGLAGRLAGLDENDPIRTCDRRLEVWSDTPDPFMEHFEKHFQLLDVLRAFKGVILVDPREPSLL